MKRLSKHNRWWTSRQERKRRRFARQAKAGRNHASDPHRLVVSPGACLLTPEGFDECSALIAEIRAKAESGTPRLLLDFSQVEHPLVAAVLRIHAEVEYLRTKHSGFQVRYTSPTKTNAKSLLVRSRFLNTAEEAAPVMPGVLPITRCVGRPHLQSLFKRMNESIYGGKVEIDDDAWQGVSGAIAEAVHNVQDHAYDHEERTEHLQLMGERWWLYAETHGNTMWLAVYDKGVGIPKMLPIKRPGALGFLRAVAPGQSNDGLLLEAAMKDGHSRFVNLPHGQGHGKGLHRIQQLADSHPEGKLFIASGKGFLVSEAGDLKPRGLKKRIHGTLIQWSIALPAVLTSGPQ